MVSMVYPDFPFRWRDADGRRQIFDSFRKRWVFFTPEEWVRQNFLQFLIQSKKYPASLIAVEKEMKLGELNKRFDILVYDRDHQPWMMVECKSMDIVLTEDVLHQLLRYNIAIPVPYLVITNGSHAFFFERNSGKLESLTALPDWLM
jgi:hypothetical protein